MALIPNDYIDTTMENDAVVVVYAKAPIPGEVKTRMTPHLTQTNAAMLHVALVERALETACATNFDVVLCAAPDASHPFFDDCATDFDIELETQLPSPNLGARMLHTLNDMLQDWSRVIIIGADCPALTTKHLEDAVFQLSTSDIVIAPAEDGGYVLIGARKTHNSMFANIDWGTSAVMAQQRTALDAAQLRLHEMATLWDVDRPEDLPRLQTLKPPLLFSLPS
jgi:uncharacterized protein